MSTINPASYSFTPPSPLPTTGYYTELRISPDNNVVVASESIVSSAAPFSNLRNEVLAAGKAGIDLVVNIFAVSGSVKSSVATSSDLVSFQVTPGPVTNIVITA